jgi:hypothetical protein
MTKVTPNYVMTMARPKVDTYRAFDIGGRLFTCIHGVNLNQDVITHKHNISLSL